MPITEGEHETLGRMVPGQADAEEVTHGMTVTFDHPCSAITELDLLFIRAPSGEPLRLLPDEPRDADSVYVFFGLGTHASSLRGWLQRLDERRWQFFIEPHHLELQKAAVI